MKKYIIEFTGTFFLVLVIGMTTYHQVLFGSSELLAPFAIGSILMVMVYMGGPISGAHYNPAVTFAILLRKKISATEALLYMVSQVLAALCASVFFYLMFRAVLSPPAPAPGFHYNIKPMIFEMIFTFALASVVLNVATAKKSAGNSYFGLAIGFTVAAGAIACGPYTGGAFNPAVTLGPMIVDSFINNFTLHRSWFYLVGQFGGGALAAWVFMLTNPEEMQS